MRMETKQITLLIFASLLTGFLVIGQMDTSSAALAKQPPIPNSPQISNPCIVPSSMYEMTFDDYSADKGKIAWYCQTKSTHIVNHTNEEICVFVREVDQDLNMSGYRWGKVCIDPQVSKFSEGNYGSGRGGTASSLVEYHLPVDMVAIYATGECRQYVTVEYREPPAFALGNTVPLVHPCPGPDGSGGMTAGDIPLAAPQLPAQVTSPATPDLLNPGAETNLQEELSPELQLAELLIYYEEDRLEFWPGWEGLTRNQQHALLEIFERVETIRVANTPLSSFQQSLLNTANLEEAAQERKKDEMEQRLVERYRDIERVELLLNRERIRQQYHEQAVQLFDLYRAVGLVKSAYERVKNYFSTLLDGEQLAQDQAVEWAKSQTGKPFDEALLDLLRETVRTANDPGLVHYGYYAERYNINRANGMDADQAHTSAMSDLVQMMQDPTDDFLYADAARVGDYWDIDKYKDAVADGGLYDQVFRRLGGGFDVGVSR